MSHTLKDMTLAELWQLFPIVMTPHRPQWEDWARAEIESLSALLIGIFSDNQPYRQHSHSEYSGKTYN